MTVSPRRRHALGEQVQWIAELAESSVDSDHDRARIGTRLASVREALEIRHGLCAGEEKEYKRGENSDKKGGDDDMR